MSCIDIRGVASSHPTKDHLAPRPGDDVVSSEWMEFILKDKQVIPQEGVKVSNVVVEELGENRGFNGVMRRLVVSYEGNNATETLPTTFILKRSDASEQGRQTVLSWKPHREALFYASDLLEKVVAGPAPHVLYAYGNGQVGEYVILMKDLKKPQTVGLNIVFGNQIWGVGKYDFELPQPLDMLKEMYLNIAKIHASNWNNRSLLQYEFLKAAKFYNQQDRELWEEGMAKTRKGWETAKKRSSESTVFKLSEKLLNVIEKSMEKASWESFQESINAEPFALCHGDFHGSNFLIDVATKKIDALDWTEVGLCTPTTDLVQTLISDIKPELFVQHSKELVRLYWEELVKNGVSETEYPFEKCWTSFCKDGVERWIWLLTICCEMTQVPDVLLNYFNDQILAFIEAHGDLEYYVMKTVV
ncbi:aminoglycoside phosphotransferase [Naegleria gruberi]|uniref:Aminoglycoside phosphotransferase n=1 Tax=Naegleria gruberi TaxID=5762 RepID=D2V2C6_NAEGR|nr:aminoglycoside phosphotransferase [Naegleria gruberi]EFC49033.1 aminoglycoside phosphotransferase [Naegleria gruberi]|eukprot:XP_002681777.1 aminoglycoside phosphotransferase [Naegleria gruberi strain NEG-M]